MRKTTIYLPQDLDRELKAASRRTGTSSAELIRTAIRQSLTEQESPWPSSIGSGSNGSFPAADDEAVLEREWVGSTDAGRRSRR